MEAPNNPFAKEAPFPKSSCSVFFGFKLHAVNKWFVLTSSNVCIVHQYQSL